MGNNQFTFNSMLITAGGRHFSRVESVFDENRLFAHRYIISTKLWSLETRQVLSTSRVCWQHVLTRLQESSCKKWWNRFSCCRQLGFYLFIYCLLCGCTACYNCLFFSKGKYLKWTLKPMAIISFLFILFILIIYFILFILYLSQ